MDSLIVALARFPSALELYLAVLMALIVFTLPTFYRFLLDTIRNLLSKKTAIVPVSVNFHFTRKCNYECGFCFHTEKTSHVESIENMKRGLRMLQQAGMKKINFAGGEPLLYPHLLAQLVAFCKEELHLESVSIVTNGSKLTEKFMTRAARYIDIIAVSCDSFNEQVNILIGRGHGAHLDQVQEVARLCRLYGVRFKINTVVNRYNVNEDMNQHIQALQPSRWKCFQVLVIEGENDSNSTIRDARRFEITDDEFQQFCDRHSHQSCFVPEPNNVMRSSYLILDEYMRFLNKGTGDPTESILDVGVTRTLDRVYWDEQSFHERGGIYDWSKETAAGSGGCSSEGNPALEF
jgi:radical S-adenosyl methionine domain-containing protein 2